VIWHPSICEAGTRRSALEGMLLCCGPSHAALCCAVLRCCMQDTGVFNQTVEAKNMQEQMMTNPDMMQGMMKAQLGGVLPQVRPGVAASQLRARGTPLELFIFTASPAGRSHRVLKRRLARLPKALGEGFPHQHVS
jgi:hypothetical protein